MQKLFDVVFKESCEIDSFDDIVSLMEAANYFSNREATAGNVWWSRN